MCGTFLGSFARKVKHAGVGWRVTPLSQPKNKQQEKRKAADTGHVSRRSGHKNSNKRSNKRIERAVRNRRTAEAGRRESDSPRPVRHALCCPRHPKAFVAGDGKLVLYEARTPASEVRGGEGGGGISAWFATRESYVGGSKRGSS